MVVMLKGLEHLPLFFVKLNYKEKWKSVQKLWKIPNIWETTFKFLRRTVYYKVALNFCLTPLYFWNLECSDEKLSVKVAIVFLSSKQNDWHLDWTHAMKCVKIISNNISNYFHFHSICWQTLSSLTF
jgi:hypothetical protein